MLPRWLPLNLLTRWASSAFGSKVAEPIIREHYAATMPPWNPPTADWYDGAGVNSYVELFLAPNNPHINNPKDIARLKAEFRSRVNRKLEIDYRFPDIISHKPDRKEYYEIKPDSTVSVYEGLLKCADLDFFFQQSEKLPYRRGKLYPKKPFVRKYIDLPTFVWKVAELLGKNPALSRCTVKLFLQWSRVELGLIAYRVGYETNCEELDDKAVAKYLLYLLMTAVEPKFAVKEMSRVEFVDIVGELLPLTQSLEASLRYHYCSHYLLEKKDLYLFAERDIFTELVLKPRSLYHQIQTGMLQMRHPTLSTIMNAGGGSRWYADHPTDWNARYTDDLTLGKALVGTVVATGVVMVLVVVGAELMAGAAGAVPGIGVVAPMGGTIAETAPAAVPVAVELGAGGQAVGQAVAEGVGPEFAKTVINEAVTESLKGHFAKAILTQAVRASAAKAAKGFVGGGVSALVIMGTAKTAHAAQPGMPSFSNMASGPSGVDLSAIIAIPAEFGEGMLKNLRQTQFGDRYYIDESRLFGKSQELYYVGRAVIE